MKTKQKNLIVNICILLIIVIAFLIIGIIVFQNSQQKIFSLFYTTSTEGSFVEINITNSKLIFKHVDYESIKDRCAQWIYQVPCWEEQDIKTDEATLSSKEIKELIDFISQSGFFELKEYYGPENERCYSRILEIKINNEEKEVNCCGGSPNSGPIPSEFTNILNELHNLLMEKLNMGIYTY